MSELKSPEQQALEIVLNGDVDFAEVGKRFVVEYPALFVMLYQDKNMMVVKQLAKVGKYVEAIKTRREITGEGLKDAKEYVDNLRNQNGW